MIEINRRLSIPEQEVWFEASPSSGPGGQHVNRAHTRITLLFDVEASPSLREDQKKRIRSQLASRIGSAGILRVTVQTHRSQLANRKAAVARFAELLRKTFKRQAVRRKTAVSEKQKQRRLETKRRRAEIKAGREKTKIES